VQINGRFETLIAVCIEGEWIAVEDAERALRLLETSWPDANGPSYARALKSCRAFVEGDGTAVGAKSTFAVAAMEAGIPFELFDDYVTFAATQVALAAEQDIRAKAPIFEIEPT
jgi:hypothetical protein